MIERIDNRPSASSTDECESPTASESVYGIRSGRGKNAFQINEDVMKVVLDDMDAKGEFLFHDENSFFLPRCLQWPMLLNETDPLCRQLLSEYHLSRGEQIYDHVIDQLNLHAIKVGRRVKLHRFSYFDVSTMRLYIPNRGFGMIRIAKDGIEMLPNGADGILFWEPQSKGHDPIQLIDDPTCVEDFEQCIIESVTFNGSDLEKQYQSTLYRLYLSCLFFREIMPTCPLLMLVGEPGSGKTYSLSKVGRLLYGSDFKATQMPGNSKDFDAIVTNRPFVVLDDVESLPNWLNDRLAVCATGGEMAARNLYTTNALASFPIIARLALTAHSPRFRRSDVADRLLLLSLPRLNKFKASCELDEEFAHNEARIYSGLIYCLQGVISALAHTSDYRYEGSFRMADFAGFAMRMAIAWDEEDQVRGALEWISGKQGDYAYEEDPLVEIIEGWLSEKGNPMENMEIGELYAQLVTYSTDHHLSFTSFCNSRTSLGKRLASIIRWEECPFSVTRIQLRGRAKRWTIRMKEEGESERGGECHRQDRPRDISNTL
jgi:hypothetical protein